MVRAIILVKSPKRLIAARLRKISHVSESFPVSGQFDAVAVIDIEKLSQIKDITTETVSYTHLTLTTKRIV